MAKLLGQSSQDGIDAVRHGWTSFVGGVALGLERSWAAYRALYWLPSAVQATDTMLATDTV